MQLIVFSFSKLVKKQKVKGNTLIFGFVWCWDMIHECSLANLQAFISFFGYLFVFYKGNESLSVNEVQRSVAKRVLSLFFLTF